VIGGLTRGEWREPLAPFSVDAYVRVPDN